MFMSASPWTVAISFEKLPMPMPMTTAISARTMRISGRAKPACLKSVRRGRLNTEEGERNRYANRRPKNRAECVGAARRSTGAALSTSQFSRAD